MKLLRLDKVKDGKYLTNYELTYENKAGKEKIYEIVSRSNLDNIENLGEKVAGVAIFAKHKSLDKILLLEEFRMAVNKPIINIVSGMIDENESVEESIKRELYEETGLTDITIDKISKPSYSAVGMSDEKLIIAYVKVDGTLSNENTSDNESLKPTFYSREEVRELLDTREFASRTQILCENWLCRDY